MLSFILHGEGRGRGNFARDQCAVPESLRLDSTVGLRRIDVALASERSVSLESARRPNCHCRCTSIARPVEAKNCAENNQCSKHLIRLENPDLSTELLHAICG